MEEGEKLSLCMCVRFCVRSATEEEEADMPGEGCAALHTPHGHRRYRQSHCRCAPGAFVSLGDTRTPGKETRVPSAASV